MNNIQSVSTPLSVIDEVTQFITNLVEKHGFVGLLGIVLVYIIIGLLKSAWFSNLISKLSDKFIESFIRKNKDDVEDSIKKITDSNITNHDIFTYIDFWRHSKVPTFQFSTEYRTLVFRKYLSIYLKNYKQNVLDFITSKEYEGMDESQMLKLFLHLINKTVYDYEKEMVEAGIPNIIIEKMKAKNNDNILLTIDLVEGICSSPFYNSEKNRLKVYSILNILLSVLENTVNKTEDICKTINGALGGMEFGGKTEPKH
jgi:hypothetical protein